MAWKVATKRLKKPCSNCGQPIIEGDYYWEKSRLIECEGCKVDDIEMEFDLLLMKRESFDIEDENRAILLNAINLILGTDE